MTWLLLFILGAAAPQLQAACDGTMTVTLKDIEKIQPGYQQSNSRSWQGLRTPTPIPVDGVDRPTNPNRKPNYQKESWADMKIVLPPGSPCTIEVFTHKTKAGNGYTTIFTLDTEGGRYEKAVGVGVGSSSFDWRPTKVTK